MEADPSLEDSQNRYIVDVDAATVEQRSRKG
jgi:hypothetical protein